MVLLKRLCIAGISFDGDQVMSICFLYSLVDLSFSLQQPMELENLNPWFFPVPSCLCSIVAGSNHDFMSSIYRVVISSPVVKLFDYLFTLKTPATITTISCNVLTVVGYMNLILPLSSF